MNAPLHILHARIELHARSNDGLAFDYLRQSHILMAGMAGTVGYFTVAPILDCGAGRFEFAKQGEADREQAFILEAFEVDGETVADLVAWPCSEPARILSMFGRISLLGLTQVLNPTTYFLGLPLDMHRTGLEWLQADCRGAAIVTPHLAAPILLDTPGPIAGRDDMHAHRLAELARSSIPTLKSGKFLTVDRPRKVA